MMMKTLKITDDTHTRLQLLGNIGNTFDDVLKKLLDEHVDFENVILQVKLVGNKRVVHLKNPLYYWTDENYDAFLKIAFEMDGGKWGEEVLKRIAKNSKWYEKVKKYRSEI
jgi:predicted CopG family antitoxin